MVTESIFTEVDMSANGIWTSRYQNEEGYGDTMFGWGPVRCVDGKVFIASIELNHWFQQFEGKLVGFEIVSGLKLWAHLETPDKKILPLVRAMNDAGIPTLSSCEGHMTPRVGGDYYRLKPHVDYLAKFGQLIQELLPEGWETVPPYGDPQVLSLQPKKDAKSQEELDGMQAQALELASQIRAKI